jgi:hypothetical protein
MAVDEMNAVPGMPPDLRRPAIDAAESCTSCALSLQVAVRMNRLAVRRHLRRVLLHEIGTSEIRAVLDILRKTPDEHRIVRCVRHELVHSVHGDASVCSDWTDSEPDYAGFEWARWIECPVCIRLFKPSYGNRRGTALNACPKCGSRVEYRIRAVDRGPADAVYRGESKNPIREFRSDITTYDPYLHED